MGRQARPSIHFWLAGQQNTGLQCILDRSRVWVRAFHSDAGSWTMIEVCVRGTHFFGTQHASSGVLHSPPITAVGTPAASCPDPEQPRVTPSSAMKTALNQEVLGFSAFCCCVILDTLLGPLRQHKQCSGCELSVSTGFSHTERDPDHTCVLFFSSRLWPGDLRGQSKFYPEVLRCSRPIYLILFISVILLCF